MNLPLKPFSTPNYVILEMPPQKREEGSIESPTFSLDQIEAEILSLLCDDFREEIFKKAGKVDPKK
jgi:hypothetical protein